VQASVWIQNHVLLYKKTTTLVLAQSEMGKRAKSIYYEVYCLYLHESWSVFAHIASYHCVLGKTRLSEKN